MQGTAYEKVPATKKWSNKKEIILVYIINAIKSMVQRREWLTVQEVIKEVFRESSGAF